MESSRADVTTPLDNASGPVHTVRTCRAHPSCWCGLDTSSSGVSRRSPIPRRAEGREVRSVGVEMMTSAGAWHGE